jgi:hypothetical protein
MKISFDSEQIRFIRDNFPDKLYVAGENEVTEDEICDLQDKIVQIEVVEAQNQESNLEMYSQHRHRMAIALVDYLGD